MDDRYANALAIDYVEGKENRKRGGRGDEKGNGKRRRYIGRQRMGKLIKEGGREEGRREKQRKADRGRDASADLKRYSIARESLVRTPAIIRSPI